MTTRGKGSALADTSALALVADRFVEENERQRALGISLAFISFGSLIAPPFGGALFEYVGHAAPFLILALLCLFDGILVGFVEPVINRTLITVIFSMIADKKAMEDVGRDLKPVGTPMWRLMVDPYIAIIAGALVAFGEHKSFGA